MKTIILSVLLIASASVATAQKYYSKTASISFINKTNVENIEATNKAVTAVIDAGSGSVAFSATIKSFTFSKSLMQTHFNDNYMESGKYPKADFKGTIDKSKITFTKDGTYTGKVTGKLTMHGVTKDVSTTGTITVKSGAVSASASFTVSLDDYKIKSDKISKTTTISVSTGTLTKM